MGIQGLLKGLQPFSEKSHIKKFSNKSLAIDASSWLHKSVYSISEQYVEATEKSRTRMNENCVRVATCYMERRCKELFHRDQIGKIYLVFDGKRCPLKVVTNNEREKRRQNNISDARKYKQQGNRQKAAEKYRSSIKIHPNFADAIAKALMKVFKRNKNFQCVFSPYEADAQLVKLCIDGRADAIITEDSDVLVYSATCYASIPIIYKLDRHSGTCDVTSMDWLLCSSNDTTKEGGLEKKSGGSALLTSILLSFANRQKKQPGHGVRLFVQACILAGSDYSPNTLSGIGVVTSFKLMRENANGNCNDRFSRVLQSLSKKNIQNLDLEEYEAILARSEAVFYLHPVVAIDDNNKVITLTPPNFSNEQDFVPLLKRFAGDLSFIGEVDINGSRGMKELRSKVQIKRTTDFPLNEVVIEKASCKRKQPNSQIYNAIDVGKCNNNIQREVKPKKNPYKSKVETQVSSNNDLNPTNPFLKFVHSSRNPSQLSNKASSFNGHSDLRFAKRTFNKVRKRSTNEILKGLHAHKASSSKNCKKNAEDGLPFKSKSFDRPILKEIISKTEISQLLRDDFDDQFNSTPPAAASSILPTSCKVTEDGSYLSDENHSNRFYQSDRIDLTNLSTNKSILKKNGNENTFVYGEEDDDLRSISKHVTNPSPTPMNINASDIEEYSEPNSITSSKYFSRKLGKARRVTLDSMSPSKCNNNNDYDLLSKHHSPGNNSVISELSELQAPNSPIILSSTENSNDSNFQSTPFQNNFNSTPNLPSSTGNSFLSPKLQRHNIDRGDSEFQSVNSTPFQNNFNSTPNLPSSTGNSFLSPQLQHHNLDPKFQSANSTPFQNNFNSIRRNRSLTNSERKQTTLFDAWSSGGSSSKKRRNQMSQFRSTIKRPKVKRITDYFYKSPIDDDSIDGDSCFEI